MRKLFLLLASIVMLAIVALVGVGYFLGSIVRAGVNRYGPPLTKTTVELASAEVSPLTGHGTIKGLIIGNPPGWRSDRAVYLGQMHVAVVPRSVFGDHIIINDILIDKPEFTYETKIFDSNLKELLKNVESSADTRSQSAAPTPAPSDQPRRFEVKRFRLQNARITIGVGSAAITVPMPTIAIDDLGANEGGLTASQLAAAVSGKVLRQVLLTAADAIGNAGKSAGAAATDKTANATKKVENRLRKLFGSKN